MSIDSLFWLEHFDKYIRVYTKLIDIALFQVYYELENHPEHRPVLTLNERLEIVRKITREGFIEHDLFKVNEDQIYKD